MIYQQTLGSPEDFREQVLKMEVPNLWKPDARSWIPVEALPTLGTGKLDLKGLKDIAATLTE